MDHAENENEPRRDFFTGDFTIGEIFYWLFKGKWLILALLILFVLGAYFYSHYADDTPLYSASSSMVVNAKQVWTSGETVMVTQSATDIYLAQKLVNTYSVIIKSSRVMEYVINDLKLALSPDEIRSWIKLEPLKDTQILFLTVTCAEPKLAVDIANSIMRVAPQAMMETVEIGSINVLDEAKMPKKVEPTAAPRNMGIALVLALLLGGGLSILIGMLSPKVRDAYDIRERLLFPTLGEIPHVEKKDKSADLTYTSGDVEEHFVNAVSMLGSVFMYLSNAQNIKTVVITSAREGEGKTTLAVDMAYLLSASGKSVLLIDLDLRKPDIHNRFKLEKDDKNNISSVIKGVIGPEEGIKEIQDNLYFLEGEHVGARKAAALLNSLNMKAVLEHYKERYDYVIIDTPPVYGAADAVALMGAVDGIVMVIKQDWATLKMISECLNDLKMAGGKVLGCILNDIRREGTMGHYKKYYYDYGQGNHAEKDLST